MERITVALLVVIATLCIINHVQALIPSQKGFISLDCGLPESEASSYNESVRTGLLFSSDAEFIQSGETGRIKTDLENRALKPYRTLRYFPEGIRNCYNLPVDKGSKYLIKAWFIYGNYDESDIKPNFDLYIGPNLWATVDMQNVANNRSTSEEILHIPTSSPLQICLVKTGKTTPLINSLELRPMENKAYITWSGSLQLVSRRYVSNSTNYIRYPYDAYDRLWLPIFLPERWTLISTPSDVDNSNMYMAPKDALNNAAIPTNNTSASLTIEWSPKNPDDQYYAYEHLAEIQDLQDNETRELTVSLNGENPSDPVTPRKLRLTTMQSQAPRTCKGGECSLQLKRTPGSTLPPLLNAYEIYRVIKFLQPETNKNEVVAITSIKDIYELKRIDWQGDPCVPQRLMWDGLNCSDSVISTSPRITSLNLSSSGLTGTIAPAIQNLTHLEKLDLSNNNLTGELPEFLGDIKSLLFINLSGNDLNGSIPQALRREGVELVLLPGNAKLCQTSSCTKPPSKKFPIRIVAPVVSVAILIAALVSFIVLIKKKLSVEAPQFPPNMLPMVNATSSYSHDPLIEMKRRRFTYSDVIYMTNNFHRVLGKGGFGQVYHGTLNESEQVAVKVLSQSSSQGSKQFKAEVDLLLRVHHTNLVSLVGYCDEEDHLALIYEFVPNGALNEHLSGKHGRPIINWGMRLRIAMEAALGLEYLHTGCTPPMVHRDVKTTNILLGEHLKAQLADFGLSRSFPIGNESHISTKIAGTPGYLDPEYYQTGRLSEKSDVYSFGIVLLEIITNQPVIDHTHKNSHIGQWVGTELSQGDISKIMDPNLQEDYDSCSAWRALELAMSCTNPSSSRRPDMSQIVIELKGCLVTENSRRDTNMAPRSSIKVSMSFDTDLFPTAR